MARLATTGVEWNDTSSAIGSTDPITGTGVTITSSDVRTGNFALAIDTTVAGNANSTYATISGSTTVTYFLRAYVNFSSLGSGSGYTGVLGMVTPTTGIVLSNGVLKFRQASGTVAAASFTPSTGTWYRLEFSYQSSSGAWEWAVDGSQIGSGTSTSASTPSTFRVGGFTTSAPAPTWVATFDDMALNDNTGTQQNSWCDEGKIVLLLPASLNANGGSWTDDNSATTSAALTAALNNTPPKGIADTGAGGGDHQVRNAAANTNLDMNLTDYATAGLLSSDMVTVLVPQCVVGAPVVTGAKTGSFGILSNPAIAQRTFTGGGTAAANFWRGAAAGTYAGSGWGWEVGTTTYAPSLVLGTQPVARLSITGGTVSRIALCCDLGVYVEYQPAAQFVPVPTHLPFV